MIEIMEKNEIKEETKKIEVKKSFLDKSIDFVFYNDERKWLILIVFFGFLFRLVNVKNHIVLGDPPHFTVNAVNFLNSGLLVTWDQSVFLWHALTDIFYKFFGITQFASRFSSLLFGTLTIIAMYLFVKEFSGNKKIALISALIYSFTPTFIFHTADEQDISVFFFMITTFYFLIKGLKKESKFYLLSSSVFFGVACMWKAYVPILIVPYLGIILYFNYTKRFDIKKNYKILIYALVIIFLLCLPTLVYNYLNFKHNGLPTFFFVKVFGGENLKIVKETYGWVSAGELYNDSFSFKKYLSESFIRIDSLLMHSHFLWILLFIGLFSIFIKKDKSIFEKDYSVFFLLYFILPYIFIINGNYLSKHFLQFLGVGIPLISNLIFNLYQKISENVNINNFIKNKFLILCIFVLLIEFFYILSIPFSTHLFFLSNPEGPLLDYKLKNIPSESLIIYDERIYNSLAMWLFNDRYFVSTINFAKFQEYNEVSNNKKNIPVFIVECGIGECGWASNPDLNNFSEAFFLSVKNNSIPKVFSSKELLTNKKYYNPLISKELEKRDNFIVYKTNMLVDINIAKEFKKQYNSFMYPIGYENKNQEYFKIFIYEPKGFFEISLDKFAWFIFYLEIFLSLFSVFFILYELYNS